MLQTHISPSGKPEKEATSVALRFAAEAPQNSYTTIQLPPQFGVLNGIQIPPGEKNYTLRDSFVLPIDCDAFAVGAHAHYLGKRMSMTATLPDGTIQPLNTGRKPGFMGPGAGCCVYHHYTFQLYALDTKLNLGPDATRAQIMSAMDGHVLGKAVLVGRFHRPQQ